MNAAARRSSSPVERMFYVVLLFWMALPFLARGDLAQDALPFVVAGDLVREHPDDIYTPNGDLFTPPPRFYGRACELSPPGTDCATVTVSFVSPPIALPFSMLVAHLGADAGVLLFRLIASASLAGGMLVLGRRLIRATPRAPAYLLASALLLTPFVLVPLGLGQNGPLMFLSACLGTEAAIRWRRAAVVGGVLALTVMFKFSPLVLLAVLLWQRRWKAAAATVTFTALLTAVTLALVPSSLFTAFSAATRALPQTALGNPYNGAVDNGLYLLWSPLVTNGASSALVVLLKVALAAGGFWMVATRSDRDTQWAYTWVLLMLFLPMVWWHYLFVAVPAIAYGAMHARDPDRALVALPAAAAVGVPISIINSGSGIPWAQALYLLAVVVAVPLLAWARPGSERSGTEAVEVAG